MVMKKSFLIILSLAVMVFTQCTNTNVNKQVVDQKNINDQAIEKTQKALTEKFGSENLALINRGVEHAASLWRSSDGSAEDFESFCLNQYINDKNEKEVVFKKVSKNFESLWGHQNKILLDLNENMHLDNGPYHKIDAMFAGYSPDSHFSNDFYANKIAL